MSKHIDSATFGMQEFGFGKRIGNSYDVIARNAIIRQRNERYVRIYTIAGSFIMN